MNDPVIPVIDPNIGCPCCDTKFEFRTDITGRADQPLHKGMIMVCASCAAVLRLGDSNFYKMSRGEMEALSSTEKSILKTTVASVLMTLEVQKKQKNHRMF